ncbi:DUF5074 domain-containing protein [Salinimicrobium sp. GXAS 041]|uniref:DUF5074 domain-containing protein n=1 Tax=Salinimicrobium sp. GXAS 041 TaxID=3400806 RepID=UPI003C746329
MKISKLFLSGLMGIFLLNSCSNDDDTITPEPISEGDYNNGLFVLNEGGIGSVTYISDDLQTVENDIYAAVNEGDDIGQYAQSMFFTDELAFIISGSNVITVVDRYTFELVGKVDTGLQGPRYGAVVDGKAYVTNHGAWDNYTDDYLVVIDVETLEIEETIVIGDVAETVIAEDGLLYIQNAAFGNGSNNISVFNPETKAIERTIEANAALNDFEIYENRIYALSEGGLQVRDLGSGEIVSEITFSEDLTGAGELDVDNDVIYYTINSDVYMVGADATEPAENAIITISGSESFSNLYGFEVQGGRIYVADSGDYSSNSSIYIYSIGGELLEEIAVGIAPNGFYFNN